MTDVQVYRPARCEEDEAILAALAGLPPIGSRWVRVQIQDGRRSPNVWIVVAHRKGKAMTLHAKCNRWCHCTYEPRVMPTWTASRWERVG